MFSPIPQIQPIKPIDLPELKPIGTDSVSSGQSLNDWHAGGGGVPLQYKGREHVWHKKVAKFAAGGEVYNTNPDMSDGGEILQAPAYARGGEVHMGAGGFLAKAMKGAQKILPAAEREANKAKFLEPSVEKRRMYHGTGEDVNQFRTGRHGVFLSPESEFANEYARSKGANVMPVRVQVKNPFDYENAAHVENLRELSKKRFPGNRIISDQLDEINKMDNWSSVEHPDIQKLIQQAGHDSFYANEYGVKNLGVYDPKRIKSDIGNRGTYDINEADINKAKGGDVHMAEGGAATGVFPQMKPRRAKQDREAAKNVPVDLARGFASGVLGAPGDIESLIRMPYDYLRAPTMSELVTGDKTSKTFLPTSEEVEQRLPLRSESPVSKAAAGMGSLAGGFYTGPGAPIRLAGALPSAVKRAGQDFAQASAAGVPHVVSKEAPQVEAMRLAQQRAALPSSQGGLGLAAENTAQQRAAAMGFNKDTYHGSFRDIKKLDPSVGSTESHAGKGIYSTDSPQDASRNYASIYGPDVSGRVEHGMEARDKDFRKIHRRMKDEILTPRQQEIILQNTVGADNLGVVYPLKVRSDKSIHLDAPESNPVRIGPFEHYDEAADAYVDTPYTARFNEALDEFKGLGGEANPIYEIVQDYGDAIPARDVFNAIKKTGNEGGLYDPYTGDIVSGGVAAGDFMKHFGIDEIRHTPQFGNHELNIGKEHTISLDPDNVRSRFAAFDPFRKTAAIAAAMGVAAPDLLAKEKKKAQGGEVHMAGAGDVGKAAAKLAKMFKKEASRGVEPIIVRTPEERAVIEKFGQKQEQEAVRQKKVEKAAKSEEPQREVKSKGKREKVEADTYRKMAEEQGDEAVLKAARAGEHLKPTASGYVGAPRTVTSGQGLGAMRRAMDKDFADSVEAVRLADPERLGTWYDRAKQGIAESAEPYQLPRTLEQHGVYSAGVSPESELTFALKHLNSRNAGNPQMAYRGAGMRNLDTAVAQDRPANMGFKIGEYANKNDPRIPNEGLFGVNDFRRAQGMGYTDPQGNPWKAGVSDTMHPFMDAETALQVDRANTAGTGGRTDWKGPHIQEVPWVYGKAQDLHGRGLKGRYAGDELEGIKSAIQDANNTARDYMYKHAASATHEAIPGASLGHVRQALDMTPEEKLAYGRQGRWDLPAPEYALSDMPDVGAGNRDVIYSAMGYRQLPSREAQGLYMNKLGGVETNPMTIARPLMDFPTGGGGGRMADESSKMMDVAEQTRALMDAQEAGAYNLPNTMGSVKGKNSMVFDTRGMNPDKLADPTAGVLPTSEQLAKMGDVMGEHGFGVTATNRGAVAFPFDSGMDPKAASLAFRKTGKAMQDIFPSSQEKAITSTGYVPGVGKRSPEGPLSTAPYSGEATSDLLKAYAELPQSAAMNVSESEAFRNQVRAKALRDSKMGGARGDIQETRRFFSEADWPKAVEMIRRGMTPAAALAALGYSASSMAGQER